MQKCRQTPCPSSLLANPSSAGPWLLEGGSAALRELLAAQIIPFPSRGCQQTPEAGATAGVSLQAVTGRVCSSPVESSSKDPQETCLKSGGVDGLERGEVRYEGGRELDK